MTHADDRAAVGLVRDFLANTETLFTNMAIVYTDRADEARPLTPEELRRCAQVYAAAAERLRSMRLQLDACVEALMAGPPSRVH